MTTPDLHFGIGTALGTAQTASQARWMEELGFEYFATGEHYMRGTPPGPTQAALTLLAVAAGATEKIRLLSAILLAPFYHPLVLAKLTKRANQNNQEMKPKRISLKLYKKI